jgi:hypothetical protein
MNNWNAKLIEEIFEKKNSEKSEDRDNLLRLTSQRLYGEKIHYALELIQNAEDEGSSSIIFIFSDENTAVINNGRPFNEGDVWGICSVQPGRKKNKIGFFGIGFKSVFNITENPQIISSNFNFEIEDYIYPRPKSSIPRELASYYAEDKGAIFVLPYSPELPTPRELIENFNLIDDKILLFLENIKELKFIDNSKKTGWEIKKEFEDPSRVSLIDTRTNEKTNWRVFHRNLKVLDENVVPEGKEGIKETRITIAFPSENTVREVIKKSGVVYCYLPTKQRADLPFLIQADFLPTIGRERISEDPWNVWLMKELGILAADILDERKEEEEFKGCIYDLIPLSEEIQDDLVRHFYSSLFEVLKGKKVAKTTKGWRVPSICIIPQQEKIREVLFEEDLKLLFKKDVQYVDPSFAQDQQNERAYKVLRELGAIEVGPDKVIEFLQNEREFRKKNKEWFLNLYDYLTTVFDTQKKAYYGEFPWAWDEETKILYRKLLETNFILTDENRLVSLEDPEKPDRLICYPQRINLAEIHKIFSEGEIVFLNSYFQESSIARRKETSPEKEGKRKRVKEWFDNIGVKKYFKEVHLIRDVILPKFSSGKHKEYDDLKLFRIVDFVRRYWTNVESEINRSDFSPKFVDQVRETLRLKSFRRKGKNRIYDYKKPGEIYFSRNYGKNEVMEELFKGIKDVWFLSPYYLNRKKRERRIGERGRQKTEYTWRKFFEILGVWSSPQVREVNEWVPIDWKRYPWIKRCHSPHNIHQIYGDSECEDLKKLIEHCSKRKNQKEIKRRMSLLWETLEKNWKLYKEMGIENSTYRFAHLQKFGEYYFTRISNDTSSFLDFLRNANWVPGKDEGFYRPWDVFIDSNKNRFLLGEEAKYADLKANETFLKDMGNKIEPTIEEVLAHAKNYRLDHPQPTTSKTEKMKTIYAYLKDKVNSIEFADARNTKILEIKDAFDKNELFYLPREDRAWWRAVHVYWRDYSDRFGSLRGYIETSGNALYDSSLKDFFQLMGVVERPLLNECFEMLEELKASNNLDYCRECIPKIYLYMDEIISVGLAEVTSCDKEIFLSEKFHFLSPGQLFYSDDDELRSFFGEQIDILWIPFSWGKIKNLISAFGFKSLDPSTTVIKKFGVLNEIEGDLNSQLIQRLSYVEAYLSKKNPELFEDLLNRAVFDNVKTLQAYDAKSIVLDYILNLPVSNHSVTNVERDSYYSKEENRIYKSIQKDLLSSSVAKEISRMFSPGEDDVFPFLESLFSAKTEEEIKEKLGNFGLRLSLRRFEKIVAPVRIILQETDAESEAGEHEKEKLTPKTILGRPQLPKAVIEIGKTNLVDPDEFAFNEIESRIPYKLAEGSSQLPPKKIKLKSGHVPHADEEIKPKRMVNRKDAEAIALELVLRFEEFEGREPEDRHDQLGIGYDIYSKTQNNDERFIEVKHFRGAAGTWELTPHQWEKANQEREKYFVYIVSMLRSENSPIIEIIQNPAEFLMPDPPARKVFSSWHNGVKSKILLKKRN